jgi:hypothetical protein
MKKIILLLAFVYNFAFAGSWVGWSAGTCTGNPTITYNGVTYYLSDYSHNATSSSTYNGKYSYYWDGSSITLCNQSINNKAYYYNVTSVAPPPTCTETEDEINGVCYPKCPLNSTRNEDMSCSCNSDFVPVDDTCLALNAIPSNDICISPYTYIKGGCYLQSGCSDGLYVYSISDTGTYQCVSSSALPDLTIPSDDPSLEPKDYCYNAFNSLGMTIVDECRSCSDVCGGATNNAFWAVDKGSTTFFDCDCIKMPEVNITIGDKNNDNIIDSFEVTQAIKDVQSETLNPILETANKFLVTTQSINDKLVTTIELQNQTNTSLNGLKSEVTEVGNTINIKLEKVNDNIDDTNDWLEKINAQNALYNEKMLNATLANPFLDLNHTSTFICDTCPEGFQNWEGTCFKIGGSRAENIVCPGIVKRIDDNTSSPDDGSPDDGSPDGDDNVTETCDCGMFSPLVPDSLEDVVCCGASLDNFLDDKIFNDAWYEENKITLDFAPSIPCYLEPLTLDFGSGPVDIISEEIVERYIPFDVLSNIILACIYLLGFSMFVREK